MPERVAFQLKGSLFPITVMHVLTDSVDELQAQLHTHGLKNPTLFRNMPVLVDLSALSEQSALNLAALWDAIRHVGLVPVGMRQHPLYTEAAQALGVTTFVQPNGHSARSARSSSRVATRFVEGAIRSGQQIYSKGDLVILGSVSHGSELLAEGYIHIYGPLRGRALAGIHGDITARIFCRSLEAELISIAGIYRTCEDIPKLRHTGMIQVHLVREHLAIEPLPNTKASLTIV